MYASKLSFFAFCAGFAAFSPFAQAQTDTIVLSKRVYQITEKNKSKGWGFWDMKNNIPASALLFDSLIYRPKTNNYLVSESKKWGLYSSEQQPLLRPAYDGLNYDAFDNLYARNGNLYGKINPQNGKIILPIVYQQITSDGYYHQLKKDNLLGMSDLEGNVLIPVLYDKIVDAKYIDNSLLQKGSQWTVQRWARANPNAPNIWYEELDYFNDYFLVKSKGRWGVVDSTQKEIIPQTYLYIQPFFQKYLQTLLVVTPEKKMGLIRIDKNGTPITELPIEYDEVWVEDKTMKLKARKGEYKDYIFEGKPYLNLKYNDVAYYDAIQAFMIKTGKKWGIANSAGQEVAAPKYDKIMVIDGKTFLAQIDGKWGLIGGQGQNKIPHEYDDFNYDDAEKILSLKQGDYWGIFTPQGKMLVPAKYEEVMLIEGSNYLVFKGGKWGMVDPSGREKIPLQYEDFRYNQGQKKLELLKSKKWYPFKL
jgi:hypothetical protein